jgi:hypothetical protein
LVKETIQLLCQLSPSKLVILRSGKWKRNLKGNQKRVQEEEFSERFARDWPSGSLIPLGGIKRINIVYVFIHIYKDFYT